MSIEISIDHIALLVALGALALIAWSRSIFQAIKNRRYKSNNPEKIKKFQRFLERSDSLRILPILWTVTILGTVWWLTTRVVLSYS